jgi:hypothetical protein
MIASASDWLKELKTHLPRNLHRYLQVGHYGVMFNHPFCFVHVIPNAAECAVIIDAIAHKEMVFNQFCKDADWQSALFVVERPYRPQYLADLISCYGAKPLLSAVNYVWTDAGYTSNDPGRSKLWQKIWRNVRKEIFNVMDEVDRESFDALPEHLTVYRGYSICGNEIGYSWTVERTTAEWFAHRFSVSSEADGAFVASMEVSKDEILAYFTDRGESEVVVNISGIRPDRIHIERLPLVAAEAA